MSEEKLNILQRLNEVKKEIEYIKKETRVEGYFAVTHDQVTAMTRASFIKHGVMVIPSEVSSKMVEVGTTTAKGKPWMRFEANYQINFVNVDQTDDFAQITLTAHAEDYGDKAPGKAISYAVKSAVLKMLQIETGVNDESRDTENHQGATQDQSQAFFNFIKERDGLGLYLFTKRIDVEDYLSLVSKLKRTFPKGSKTKEMDKVCAIVDIGENMWAEIARAISESDAGLLAENITDLSNITTSLLEWYMTDSQKQDYEALKNEIGA